jgi:hypothetical protein
LEHLRERGASSPDDATSPLTQIAERDYSHQLNDFFSRKEAGRLLKLLCDSIPGANERPFKSGSPEYLKGLAARLGAEFHLVSFSGPGAPKRMRGFYVPKNTIRGNAPAIYVNSELTPIALGATATHEIGHHVLNEKFGHRNARIPSTFVEDFERHFNDPMELLADATVALAAYPAKIARVIFDQPATGIRHDALELAANGGDYLRRAYSTDYAASFEKKNPDVIAGLIHFAKLRNAILALYGL